MRLFGFQFLTYSLPGSTLLTKTMSGGLVLVDILIFFPPHALCARTARIVRAPLRSWSCKAFVSPYYWQSIYIPLPNQMEKPVYFSDKGVVHSRYLQGTRLRQKCRDVLPIILSSCWTVQFRASRIIHINLIICIHITALHLLRAFCGDLPVSVASSRFNLAHCTDPLVTLDMAAYLHHEIQICQVPCPFNKAGAYSPTLFRHSSFCNNSVQLRMELSF